MSDMNSAPAVGDQAPRYDVDAAIDRALRFGLPVAFAVGSIATGALVDTGSGILVLAGGALVGVIAVLWSSLRTLTGEAEATIEEAIALATPSDALERKRAILQALRDLDYEKQIGKIDEADYVELRRRYRTEAKAVLRAIDEDLGPARARAEAYIQTHLAAEAAAPTARAAVVAAPPIHSLAACAACSTDNDVDAVFCKKCGTRLDGKGGSDASD